MSCEHLRQWVPTIPGESFKLPCAERDCPDGTGIELLTWSPVPIVSLAEDRLSVVLTPQPPQKLLRQVVRDGALGMRIRHRWIYAVEARGEIA